MAKVIELSKGYKATVSDVDYKMLSRYKWTAQETKGKVYVARHIYGKEKNKLVLMHRFIMNAPDGMLVDHIDGNTLNNQRENLRLVTSQQNLMNMAKATGKSKFKGVSFNQKTKAYVVYIQHGNDVRTVNGIESERIASLIYDLMALDRFKEYACFNNKVVMGYLESYLEQADQLLGAKDE